MNVATQAQRKHFDPNCPPIRVKHFISCSHRDLDFLATHLDVVTTAKYNQELAQRTSDRGDCCMMSTVEWGHSQETYAEDVANFDDEDHMNYVGEFDCKVNETCLHGDHNIFMVAPNDRDAHNPILVHLAPSDMTWNERGQYKPTQMKMRRKQPRKETQRENRRKGYEERAQQDQGSTGYWGSSASSSRSWRQGYRR